MEEHTKQFIADQEREGEYDLLLINTVERVLTAMVGKVELPTVPSTCSETTVTIEVEACEWITIFITKDDVRLYKSPKLVQDDVDLDSKIEAIVEYIVVKQQEGQNIACKVSQ